MQDYTFAVTKQGVTITDSAGEVDTVKNVEVFHFSDGTNYLVGRHGLVQTADQNINKFLADSGVDQSYFGAVPTAGTQQQLVQAAASNAPQQTSSTPSASTAHNHLPGVGAEKLSATWLSGTRSMPHQTTQRTQTTPWLI